MRKMQSTIQTVVKIESFRTAQNGLTTEVENLDTRVASHELNRKIKH